MAGFDHFSFLAPYYDRFARPKMDPVMLEMLALPVAGWLLDAGGGTGRIGYAYRQQVGRVLIADCSLAMLRQAAGKDGLLTANALSERLPFADGTFERIIMVDALHHVIDQAATARELWRVLRPGGRLVVEEPDIHTFPIKLIALAEKLLLMRSHFLTPQRIVWLFSFPGARARVTRSQYAAWIMIEKLG